MVATKQKSRGSPRANGRREPLFLQGKTPRSPGGHEDDCQRIAGLTEAQSCMLKGFLPADLNLWITTQEIQWEGQTEKEAVKTLKALAAKNLLEMLSTPKDGLKWKLTQTGAVALGRGTAGVNEHADEGPRYLCPNGEIWFVARGIGEKWGTFKGESGSLHRVKSPKMPMVELKSAAIDNLQRFAAKSPCMKLLGDDGPPSTALVPSNGHANGNGSTSAAITVRSAAPLTSKERKRLDACEKTITSGLETVVEVGKALSEIREARLYRERYETFEAYCAAEWDMSRSYAYRQIASAEVAASPIGDKLRKRLGGAPLTEGLLRPLTKLEPEDRAAVVEAVCRDRNAPITSKTMEAKTREYVTPPEDLERSRESRVKSREAAADKKTANAAEKTMHTPSAAETDLSGQALVNFQVQLSTFYDHLARFREQYPSLACQRTLACYLTAWAGEISEGAGT